MTISRRYIAFVVLLFCILPAAHADTIYQWSDPWGQIQYSKTPVPGSMISSLSKLPERQSVTEQQKQDAMLRKMQAIKDSSQRDLDEKSVAQLLAGQRQQKEQYCRKLRSMLADVKSVNSQKYYYPRGFYYSNRRYYQGRGYTNYDYYPLVQYDFLEMDLYGEIRKNCR